MKNPFKPERSAQERDNPIVPDAVERPLERAADRAATRDNPVVPNAIEVPVERAVTGDDRGAGNRPRIVDRPVDGDSPGDRTRAVEQRADTARHVTATAAPDRDSAHIDLFPDEELAGYRARWESIQTSFVDEPRGAVEEADALVSHLVNRLTEVFRQERSTLEGQWTKGDHVSTEDLRVALTRYRSFFHRLLSM